MASCKPASGSHQHQSSEASCFVDRTYKTTLTERTVSERVRSPQIVRKSKIFVITSDEVSRTTLLRSVPLLVARRESPVGQRTLFVAFERCPYLSTSQGTSRSARNDE